MTTQMQEKVAETDVILREVAEVSQKYEPLARACSDIFFTLESLSQLHFLYQVKQLLVRVCVWVYDKFALKLVALFISFNKVSSVTFWLLQRKSNEFISDFELRKFEDILLKCYLCGLRGFTKSFNNFLLLCRCRLCGPQYSLRFFLDVYRTVLSENDLLRKETDKEKRLQIITDSLFKVYNNTVNLICILNHTNDLCFLKQKPFTPNLYQLI